MANEGKFFSIRKSFSATRQGRGVFMDTFKDILLIASRIFTIIPLLLIMALYMGRRSTGELPVFDFLIIIVLGSVVGADIADPRINHLYIAVAVVLIALLQKAVSGWALKSRKFERLINFEPVIVMKDGKFIVKNLKKIHYSVDNVLELLREHYIFSLQEVGLGIIESNGKLTVYKKGPDRPPGGFSYPVIIEGRIYTKGLNALGLSEAWLWEKLVQNGIKEMDSVFYASVNQNQELHISPADYSGSSLPPVFH
jgi:uncharacterized membrane protein YcaP (DUF421 family)